MKKLMQLLLAFLICSTLSAQGANNFGVKKMGTADQHVILIPGFSCAGTVWQTTADQLKAEYTCHILTMPGFATQPKTDLIDFQQWTMEIAEYIKSNQLSQATIIGHSMGGMMALQLAADFPELIREIVVVDALPSLAALNNPKFEADPNPNCEPVIGMFTNPTEEQFKANQQMGIAGMCVNTEKHDEIISWAMQSDKATLGEIYCQLMNFDAREFIKKIKCPTMILLEAQFKPLSTLISTQYQKLSEADLRYANQGLHFIMYDDPTWYASQLDDFLLGKNKED